MKIIRSLRDLAWTLGVPLDVLKRIADAPAEHYNEFMQWKGPKGRLIRNPKDELKHIQRLIKDRVFGEDAFGPEVQGGVSGRSPKTNAQKHLGARVLVTLDIKQFFDSVDHSTVFRTLRELGYGDAVARLLTKLTTRNALLPQGAPTSTVLANLVLVRPLDVPTRQQAAETKSTFTRFVDDVGLSGEKPSGMIKDVARRVSSAGLSVHRGAKLKIMSRAVPQRITGLNINSGRPTVPRQYRDELRAEIHGLSVVVKAEERAFGVRRIRGRIAYVRQFQPGAAERFEEQLQKIR